MDALDDEDEEDNASPVEDDMAASVCLLFLILAIAPELVVGGVRGRSRRRASFNGQRLERAPPATSTCSNHVRQLFPDRRSTREAHARADPFSLASTPAELADGRPFPPQAGCLQSEPSGDFLNFVPGRPRSGLAGGTAPGGCSVDFLVSARMSKLISAISFDLGQRSSYHGLSPG